MTADWRSHLARVAALAALLTLVWTVVVALTGGIRVHVAGVTISSRDYVRVGLESAVLFALSVAMARSGHRLQTWEWLRDRVERISPLLAVASAAGVLWFGVTYGAHAAGGADAFGYVSQAYLWLKGDLLIDRPLAFAAPFADRTLSPLAYQPGVTAHTIVPTYSSGVPLIMAGFYWFFGVCGPYFVAPVFGALLVLLTFGLAWQLTRNRLTSALAGVFMAASPALLFNLVVPMSDTVVAALWIGVLWLLTWPRVWPAALAGCLAGLATLVRPNLVPLSLAAMLAAELWGHGKQTPRRGVRALAFLAGVVPAAAAVGWLNDTLRGSPWLSGYGPASELYSLASFPGNVHLYGTWFLESQGPIVLLALLPIVARPVRPDWFTARTVTPIASFVGILSLSYLVYAQFDAWWFLRFLLGSFPFVFILLAAAVTWLARQAPAVVALPGLVIAVALLINSWLGFAIGKGVLLTGEGEQRYIAVAHYIARELPPNAIVLAMQHSGTIWFYAGRRTIRYDLLAPTELNSTLEWLAANGHAPYLVLEDWEIEQYRRQFADQGPVGRLEIALIARLPHHGVRVYDPLRTASTMDPILITPAHYCAEPRGPWRRGE